jgi:hypothetical protein
MNQPLPDDFYSARNGIIQILGENEFNKKVDEFRPILRALCEESGMSVVEAVSELSMVDEDSEQSILIKAVSAEIIEPRFEEHL